MNALKKQNGHGNTSSDTAVSLKKGDFTTPPRWSIFSKEKRRLEMQYFKTAVKQLLLYLDAQVLSRLYNGFFYYRWANSIFIKFTYLRMGANRVPLF